MNLVGKNEEITNEGIKDNQKDHVINVDFLPSNMTSDAIPFLERLKKNNKDRKFEKFLKIFEKLHTNISCIDAIT